RSLIRVTDDGLGMSRDDALLSLERHATSKIQQASDLYAITTMGFRGEALPSIASVSRFSIITRERDGQSPEGAQVIVNGGKIQEVKAAGSPPGTCVEARQLFFNLPARRKFLRSEETESAHIHHYLTLAALAHPGISFTFMKDGRLVWQLPGVKGGDLLAVLRERHRALYGGDIKLLALDHTGTLPAPAEPDTDNLEILEGPSAAPKMRVWGLMGAPGVSRATREEQHLFVNRRPVENRGINAALMEGYHTALMKGRFPVCCLFLEIPPSLVDVNIHPSKREVKFHHERAVRSVVAQAVRQTLLRFHTPELIASAAVPPTTEPAASIPVPEQTELPVGTAPSLSKPEVQWPYPPVQTPLAAPGKPPMQVEAEPIFNRPSDSVMPPQTVPVPTAQTPVAPEKPVLPKLSPGEPVPLLHVPLRLVGVIGKLYVVLESDRGLVLLDQHAAHERILFEQMLDRMERQEQAPTQRLLIAETVELPPRDAHFLRELLPTLTRLGVSLSEFGERTFLLDGLPPFVRVESPRRFVLELVDELKAAGNEVNSVRLGEHTVAKTVCRHAVKANDLLAGAELENLIRDLRQCAMPYTCPHGRPTMIEMNYGELEKKFGRSQ
ncbi:MAG: DNA mismatch repair endonuclease MutL, partial [Verrucomicrobiota bacterium]